MWIALIYLAIIALVVIFNHGGHRKKTPKPESNGAAEATN